MNIVIYQVSEFLIFYYSTQIYSAKFFLFYLQFVVVFSKDFIDLKVYSNLRK